MAQHIHGPLYYERMGRTGPVIAFVHPNPMDQSCWIFQMAHLSTWYRCIAIDIPGYGRSPKADAGLTMTDMAEACWEAIDDAAPGESAILVGCSVGSSLAPHMYHQAFRATPLAHFFANLFTERNQFADVQTIIHQFKALAQPYPEGHHERIACPTIILTGSEDGSHERAFALKARIPHCELKVLPGAGHACQIEQPWLFDRFMIEFLTKHGLFPGASKPVA
ncbi:MAG: alpha/beta hydrolase [Deltaproteobacteria bacterium]|nr:alpha/beta hydrolase [Deltaproteobacteria bacterium]